MYYGNVKVREDIVVSRSWLDRDSTNRMVGMDSLPRMKDYKCCRWLAYPGFAAGSRQVLDFWG